MSQSTAFRRILVPLDGSELATIGVPYARALAGPDTEIVLMRAVPDPTPLIELAGTSSYPGERVRARHVDEAAQYLDAVARVTRDVVPALATEVVEGEAPDAILRAAAEREADLIVMATHGRGFLGRVVIGSVADRVARAAHVPVLLVHPSRSAGPAAADDPVPLSRLVVPLDGSERARQALPVAARLARELDLPVLLLRALPPAAVFAEERHSHDAAWYTEMTGAVTEALAAEAHRLGGEEVAATSETLVGPAAETLIDALGEGDLVVMTSHGVGGVRRWLLGSVAERVIRSGAAPVVLVPVSERSALAAGLT